MTRASYVRPGWDCIRGPCSAKDCPGFRGPGHPRNHGVHGDEWHYIVVHDDPGVAMSLMCFTDIFPPTVPPSVWRADEPLHRRRYGANLELHCAFPVEDSDLLSKGTKCEFVGRCYSGGDTAIGAEAFFQTHGDPRQFEQGESFWLAMEARCQEWGARKRAEATTKHVCPTCKGAQFLP